MMKRDVICVKMGADVTDGEKDYLETQYDGRIVIMEDARNCKSNGNIC